MRAFWWFRDNSIAGMARPGFNLAHWFDLPFGEAVVLGWLGQFSSGSVSLESFRNHLKNYPPKVYKFYKLDAESGQRAIRVLQHESGLMETLRKLNGRTNIWEDFEIVGDHIHFSMNSDRLNYEIQFLKKTGISKLISLTEIHHNREVLKDHFSIHHIAIEDLGAPKLEQAKELAEIIRASKKNDEKIAIHCLAGIGRTSTMLIAAHILLGEDLKDLELQLSQKNPSFVLTGSQADFIFSISDSR